jgi:ATP-dependent Clp endopeptidase proteolytic subunit ClpP
MPIELPEWLRLTKGSLDDDQPAQMLLAEPVGFDPMSYTGMSSARFGAILGSFPKAKPVRLDINTLGGSVSEGMAMANMIIARGNVDTCVIGYAASMGAIIHSAGAKRFVMPGTMIVIHNPQGTFSGEADEMERQADALRQVKSNLVDVLASRSKLGKRAISDAMDKVTFYTPKDAIAAGFADEIIEGTSSATNDLATIFKTCQQLYGAQTGSVVGGGEPAKPKDKTMNKLTAMLVQLGLISAANLADEEAANQVQNNFNKLKGDHTNVLGEIEDHRAALKTRVTNRVEKFIADKRVKPERKDSLIALGIRNEVDLDAFR